MLHLSSGESFFMLLSGDCQLWMNVKPTVINYGPERERERGREREKHISKSQEFVSFDWYPSEI